MDYSKGCVYSTRLIKKLKLIDIKCQLDFDQINKAIYWAKKYHEDQVRKSGEPFYSHPLKVAYMISDYNLKTEVIVASILHDIIEDCEVTVSMILDAFGCRVAQMVDRLTRDRPDGNKLSVEEILNNAYQLKDKDVLLIKLFDRLHNMQTIHAKSPEKIKKTTEKTFKKFLILSIYLGERISGMLKIEENVAQLCYQNLPIKELSGQYEEVIFADSFQLVFPTL